MFQTKLTNIKLGLAKCFKSMHLPFQNITKQELDSLTVISTNINSKNIQNLNYTELQIYHKFSLPDSNNSDSCENDFIPTDCD